MGVGQLSESDAVDALRLPFYSSRHARGSHVPGNQFDLGNTSEVQAYIRTDVQKYRHTNKNSGLLPCRVQKWNVTGMRVYQGDKIRA